MTDLCHYPILSLLHFKSLFFQTLLYYTLLFILTQKRFLYNIRKAGMMIMEESYCINMHVNVDHNNFDDFIELHGPTLLMPLLCGLSVKNVKKSWIRCVYPTEQNSYLEL